MNKQHLESIRQGVARLVADAGMPADLRCMGAEWEASPPTLRVIISREQGGILLKDCAKVSRRILDSEELAQWVPDNASLEVSSPGIDGPWAQQGEMEDALQTDDSINKDFSMEIEA